MTRRLLLGVLAGALVLSTAGTTAYAAPDPTYPTGTFTLPQTTGYLRPPVVKGRPPYSFVLIMYSQLQDDTTPSDDLVIEIDTGDGTGFIPWRCSGNTCDMAYHRVGTFTPQARITDGDGHATTYTLPQVSIREDHLAPTYALTSPKPGVRHHKAAWRVIRGTASDSGIGLKFVKVIVMQKRHGRWYFYKPILQKWRQGLRTEAATNRTFHPPGVDAILDTDGTWRTPYTHGLTKGPIVARVWTVDFLSNHSQPRIAATGKITRR